MKDTDLEAQDQNKMMLSRETMEGLQITGTITRVILFVYELQFFFPVKSFVEMTKYILSETPADNSESLYFLSERISQDPIENYFGKQRARGRRNENPNMHQSVHNAAALRVQKSLALDPIRGNCRRKRLNYSDNTIDDTPLPKRKRK